MIKTRLETTRQTLLGLFGHKPANQNQVYVKKKMVQLNTTGFDMKGSDTAHYDILNSFRIMLCVVTCFSNDTLG